MRKYQIIYADPPWSFKYQGKSNPDDMVVYRACEHYQTMELEDIKKLPIKELADKNCILFMWVIDTMLPEGLEVIKNWGFEYKTTGFYWVKLNKDKTPFYGLGYWTRCNPELCLLATKGNISRKSKSVEKLVMTERLRHSQKPSIFRNKIVELMGDLSRIELFARKEKGQLFEDESFDGWDVWGNEVESDIKLT